MHIVGGLPAVETELGKLGGKEDCLEVKPGDDLYTDAEEVARLVAETRCASPWCSTAPPASRMRTFSTRSSWASAR